MRLRVSWQKRVVFGGFFVFPYSRPQATFGKHMFPRRSRIGITPSTDTGQMYNETVLSLKTSSGCEEWGLHMNWSMGLPE